MTRLNKILLPMLAVVALTSCDKNKVYKTEVAPPEAHFAGSKNQTYALETSAAPAYTVTIGTTDVADVDRTIGFNVSTTTGAVAGTHYTLDVTGTTVTIPAGSATADIKVQGKYSEYTSGRKDTLVFTLKEPSVKIAGFQDTIFLAMRGPCFDGDVTETTITQMSGNYTNTFEGGLGPYTTTLSGFTITSPTTADATMGNLWDYFGPVTVKLNWTDPTNTTFEIPLQITNRNYAAGQPFYVRSKPGQPNKFSICNQRVSFSLDVLVNIGGTLYYYDNGLAYVMGR